MLKKNLDDSHLDFQMRFEDIKRKKERLDAEKKKLKAFCWYHTIIILNPFIYTVYFTGTIFRTIIWEKRIDVIRNREPFLS